MAHWGRRQQECVLPELVGPLSPPSLWDPPHPQTPMLANSTGANQRDEGQNKELTQVAASRWPLAVPSPRGLTVEAGCFVARPGTEVSLAPAQATLGLTGHNVSSVSDRKIAPHRSQLSGLPGRASAGSWPVGAMRTGWSSRMSLRPKLLVGGGQSMESPALSQKLEIRAYLYLHHLTFLLPEFLLGRVFHGTPSCSLLALQGQGLNPWVLACAGPLGLRRRQP